VCAGKTVKSLDNACHIWALCNEGTSLRGAISSVWFLPFFASACVKAKDSVCNPVVMSVLLSVCLSVCNKPRPLTSQAIISSGYCVVQCGAGEVLQFHTVGHRVEWNGGQHSTDGQSTEARPATDGARTLGRRQHVQGSTGGETASGSQTARVADGRGRQPRYR